MRGKDIPFELARNETKIRKQIFDIVLNRVLRDEVEKIGVPWNISGERSASTHGNHDYDWDISDPQVLGDSVRLRSKMKLVFDIKVSKAVNAMQAVRAANHNIALAVTDNVISALKNQYLGITSTLTSSEIKIEDGKYKKFDIRDKGNSPTAN